MQREYIAWPSYLFNLQAYTPLSFSYWSVQKLIIFVGFLMQPWWSEVYPVTVETYACVFYISIYFSLTEKLCTVKLITYTFQWSHWLLQELINGREMLLVSIAVCYTTNGLQITDEGVEGTPHAVNLGVKVGAQTCPWSEMSEFFMGHDENKLRCGKERSCQTWNVSFIFPYWNGFFFCSHCMSPHEQASKKKRG